MNRTAAAFLALLILILLAGTHVDSHGGQSRPGRNGAKDSSEKSDFGNKKLNDFEEERSYRKDNVAITVKKLYAEEKLYWNFEISVENGNDIKKTVEGALCLFNMYIQPRECGAEECSVRMAVQPKSILIQKLRCKGKVDMNSWTFLISRVHNY
ncbi:MAG: hypothetical protein KA369_14175 [Spirochaetes bacterium]|nr:hypothetical protein [Spirochaetota bacterium]